MQFSCLVILLCATDAFVGPFRPTLLSTTRRHPINSKLLILCGSKKWKNVDFSNMDQLPDDLKSELGVSDYDSKDDYDYEYYDSDDEENIEDSDENNNNDDDDDDDDTDNVYHVQEEKGGEEDESLNEVSDIGESADVEKDQYEYEYYDEYGYYQVDEEEDDIVNEKLREAEIKQKANIAQRNGIDERVDIDEDDTEQQSIKQKYSNPKPSSKQFDYLNLGVGDDFNSPTEDIGEYEEEDYDQHEEDEDDAIATGKTLEIEEVNINEAEVEHVQDTPGRKHKEYHKTRKEYMFKGTSAVVASSKTAQVMDDPSEVETDFAEFDAPALNDVDNIAQDTETSEKMKREKHQEAKVKSVWRKLQQWSSPKRSNVKKDDSLKILGFQDDDDEVKPPIKNAEYYFQGGDEGLKNVTQVELENLSEFGEFGEWKIKPQEASSASLDVDTPPPAAFRVRQLMKAAENKYRRHDADVGSSEVQIARIHERIVHLAKHLEVSLHVYPP